MGNDVRRGQVKRAPGLEPQMLGNEVNGSFIPRPNGSLPPPHGAGDTQGSLEFDWGAVIGALTSNSCFSY